MGDQAPPLTSAEELREALRKHDWNWAYSDDPRNYREGDRQLAEIQRLCKEVGETISRIHWNELAPPNQPFPDFLFSPPTPPPPAPAAPPQGDQMSEPKQQPLQPWTEEQKIAARAKFFDAVRKLREFEEEHNKVLSEARGRRKQLQKNVDDLMVAIEGHED